MKRDPMLAENLIAPDGRVGVVCAIDREHRTLRLATPEVPTVPTTDWLPWADVKVPRISHERFLAIAEKAFSASIEEARENGTLSPLVDLDPIEIKPRKA